MLNKINSGEIKVTHIFEDGYEIIQSSTEVTEIEDYASEFLITSNGGCNLDNINKLKEAGFDVFAGEKDSFGWLTGCIRTSKGIIVYG